MRLKKKIIIILPYKDKYNKDEAGSVSLWVKEFNVKKNFSNKTLILGSSNNKKPLSENFVSVFPKISFLKNSWNYLRYIKKYINCKTNIIEIHNRPNFLLSLNKKFSDKNFIIIFHNDPLKLKGSKTINERLKILKLCKKVIFVSNWCKKKFLKKLPKTFYNSPKIDVIYPAFKIDNYKLKKRKIITFIGKLNFSKGYDVFGEATIKILNLYKDWKIVVAGNEPRKTFSFKHKNFIKFNWLSNSKIRKLLNKSIINIMPSRWDEPFGRVSMEAANLGNIVIHSGKGGLNETCNHYIKLNKVSSGNLYKILNRTLKNSFNNLIKFGQKNLRNPKVVYLKSLNKLHMIKKEIIN